MWLGAQCFTNTFSSSDFLSVRQLKPMDTFVDTFNVNIYGTHDFFPLFAVAEDSVNVLPS